MENNIENKARFFAQYWSQEVLNDTTNSGERKLYSVVPSNMYRIEESHIELIPLSHITDEDAIEIASKSGITIGSEFLIHDYESIGELKNSLLFMDNVDACFPVKLFDLIRSKGFALSWMGLSVENQIEYGWVRLKQVNNGK